MTDKQKEAFRRNVKHLLIDKDVSQKELAEAAGVSDPFMSSVINGTKVPPLATVIAIADKLGVTMDELVR